MAVPILLPMLVIVIGCGQLIPIGLALAILVRACRSLSHEGGPP